MVQLDEHYSTGLRAAGQWNHLHHGLLVRGDSRCGRMSQRSTLCCPLESAHLGDGHHPLEIQPMKFAAMVVLSGALAAGVNVQGSQVGTCPQTRQETMKVVRADLDGSGKDMEVSYFRCRLETGKLPEPTQFVFGVSVKPFGETSERAVDWFAPPTGIGTFYASGNELVPEPNSPRKLIVVTVQYGTRVVALYAFRIAANKLSQFGHWAGADARVRTLKGMLTVVVSSADRTQLPALWVLDNEKFIPAGKRFAKLYSVLGHDYENFIRNQLPTPPVWLYFNCVLALKAYSAAGEMQEGRDACRMALTRLSNRQSLRPYFPTDGSEQFNLEIKEAVDGIRAALSPLEDR